MKNSLFNNKATIIAEDINSKIRSGEFISTEKLPSTSTLASFYSVSKETVNIAMAQLVKDGLVHRKRGFGSVISRSNHRQTTPHIGIFLPMLSDESAMLSPTESPTWSLIFYSVLHACAERGYTLIPIPNKGYSWKKIISDYKLGGILLPGGRLEIVESFLMSGMQQKIKYCMMDRAIDFDTVNYTEEFSANEIHRAVKLLVKEGHQVIGAVATDEDIMVYRQFFDGYRMAMTAQNCYSPSYIKRIFEQMPAEYDQVVKELLERSAPPTVILSFGYDYATGIIAALERRNLKIPHDISVVMINWEKAKYNGREISGFIGPGKTLLGEIAVNNLIDLIEHKQKSPLKKDFTLEFCIGDTFKAL